MVHIFTYCPPPPRKRQQRNAVHVQQALLTAGCALHSVAYPGNGRRTLRLVKGSYECLKLTINRHTNTGKHRGCSFCTLMTENTVVVTRISKLILNLGAVSGYAVWFKLVTIFICLIAIAYSMGQIIKSFCVCACVCVCVCVRLWTLSRSHFFVDLHQIGHKRVNPQK